MKKYNLAVLTVIFPSNLKYWESFISSLNNQSINFDLVVIMDGIDSDELFIDNPLFKVHFYESNKSPFFNRLFGIKVCEKLGFEKVIFQDSDDLLSNNRIKLLGNLLDEFPIVCNDLNIMDEAGNIIKKNIWASRINDKEIISSKFLRDKNIVGFGNTGIRTGIKMPNFRSDIDLIAPDWYFFSVLSINYDIIFSNQVETNYRQHDNNTVGLSKVTTERILQSIDVKIQHYQLMSDYNIIFNDLYNKEIEKRNKFKKNNSDQFQISESEFSLFWWEESNLLI